MLLRGITVLDLTQNAVGHCASSALGDLGADVISLTRPGYGRARGFTGQRAVGRHKRSLTLDLRREPSQEVFRRLAARTDVILEGFRPGVAQRLGVDVEAVRAVRPDIVYCAVTGYGQDGPYRDLPGHDLNYQGVAGALPRDTDGAPMLPANSWADRCATLNIQFSVVAALLARARHGQGCYLDLSITDTMLTLPASESYDHPDIHRILNGGPPGSEDPPNPFLRGSYPAYHLYECADHRYLSLCCIEPWFWTRLCDHLDRPGWTAHHQPDPARAAEIFQELRRVFAARPRADWLAELAVRDIPVAPVNDSSEMMRDPQLSHRSSVTPVAVAGVSLHQLQLPFTIDGARPEITRGTAIEGEHTDELLRELGFTPDEVKGMSRR
ncbi:MAG: hypothetical protein GEV12_15415 [Micromonosporaceae bacterium]|nr:hypothetical protein [Micromonosporaceae bacterium]